MIVLISNKFSINLLEAEKIYLSKFRFINDMFSNVDINTATEPTIFLYNNFGKFVVDNKKVKFWKIKKN